MSRYAAPVTEDARAWFHGLAVRLGERRRLTPRFVEDGPQRFEAVLGRTPRGEPLYEIAIDFETQRASLLTRDVPYGAVVLTYVAGMQEQFSPFDDGTTSRPTRHDIRTWLELRCAGKPMTD